MQTIYEAKASTTSQPIIEKVKTFDDSCKVLGLDKVQVGVIGLDDDTNSIVAYTKLVIIAKALNEGWQPDWTDSSQRKYVPWFEHKSGFGLAYHGYGGWDTATAVGSRLCFKTAELARYAATQFADIYNDFLTIK
jgi:hypothetical protein